MDTGGDILEQFVRLLVAWGALPWWGVILLAFVLALYLVGRARGWWKPAPPEHRDDVDRRGVPEATWDDNVERNDKPDAGGGG